MNAFHAIGDKGFLSVHIIDEAGPAALSRKNLAGLKRALRGVRFVCS
jgi:hypothetical protein